MNWERDIPWLRSITNMKIIVKGGEFFFYLAHSTKGNSLTSIDK